MIQIALPMPVMRAGEAIFFSNELTMQVYHSSNILLLQQQTVLGILDKGYIIILTFPLSITVPPMHPLPTIAGYDLLPVEQQASLSSLHALPAMQNHPLKQQRPLQP